MRHSLGWWRSALLPGLALVQAPRGLLSAVLFGVTPHDVTSIARRRGAAARAALVASLPPAWRAMRVDPVDGLRAE